MLKTYWELRKIDVTPYCESRDGYLYLNWAKCIDLLRQNGAEYVNFDTVPNPKTGGSLYESDAVFTDKNGVGNRCYETRIKVMIDDKTYYMQSPVMNGTNPVKDNSMSQQRVWNSMTRSFVKCVAINTGLGFDLWLKEEERKLDYVPEANNGLATAPQKKVIQELCEKHGINLKAWLKQCGTDLQHLKGSEAGQILNAIKAKYD